MLCTNLRSRVIRGNARAHDVERDDKKWCSSRIKPKTDDDHAGFYNDPFYGTRNIAKALKQSKNISGSLTHLNAGKQTKFTRNLKNVKDAEIDSERQANDPELELLLEANLYAKWLSVQSGHKVSVPTFCEDLSDGVVLCCLLANTLKLLGMLKIHIFSFENYPVTVTERKENFRKFFQGCQSLNMEKNDILKMRDVRSRQLSTVLRLISKLEEAIHKKKEDMARRTFSFRIEPGAESKIRQFLESPIGNGNDNTKMKNMAEVVENEDKIRAEQRKRLRKLYEIELKKEKEILRNMREERLAKNSEKTNDDGDDEDEVVSVATSQSTCTSIIENIPSPKPIRKRRHIPNAGGSLFCSSRPKESKVYAYSESSDDISISESLLESLLDESDFELLYEITDIESDSESCESDIDMDHVDQEEISLDEKIKLLRSDLDLFPSKQTEAKHQKHYGYSSNDGLETALIEEGESKNGYYLEIERTIEKEVVVQYNSGASGLDEDAQEQEQEDYTESKNAIIRKMKPANSIPNRVDRSLAGVPASSTKTIKRKPRTLERFQEPANTLSEKVQSGSEATTQDENNLKSVREEARYSPPSQKVIQVSEQHVDSINTESVNESVESEEVPKRGDDCNVVKNEQYCTETPKRDTKSENKTASVEDDALLYSHVGKAAVLKKSSDDDITTAAEEKIVLDNDQIEAIIEGRETQGTQTDDLNSPETDDFEVCDAVSGDAVEKACIQDFQFDIEEEDNAESTELGEIEGTQEQYEDTYPIKEAVESSERKVYSLADRLVRPQPLSFEPELEPEILNVVLDPSESNPLLVNCISNIFISDGNLDITEACSDGDADEYLNENSKEDRSYLIDNDSDAVEKSSGTSNVGENEHGDIIVVDTRLDGNGSDNHDVENVSDAIDDVESKDTMGNSKDETTSWIDKEYLKLVDADKNINQMLEKHAEILIPGAAPEEVSVSGEDKKMKTEEISKAPEIEAVKSLESPSEKRKDELKDDEIEETFMALIGIATFVVFSAGFIVLLEFLDLVNFGFGVRLGILERRRTIWDVVWWLLSFIVRIR